MNDAPIAPIPASARGVRVSVGAVAWLAAAWWGVPHVLHQSWAYALLLFAALVLVPLVLDLVQEASELPVVARCFGLARWLQLPAALLLAVACAQSPGWRALLLASPWLGVCGLLSAIGVERIRRRGTASLALLCQDAGLVFLAVGGAWLAADRIGLRPLGFSADIVLLTAVHFHYAGLILPIVTSRILARFHDSVPAKAAGWGVLAGVPLVAAGITSAQLGYGNSGELVAAIILAAASLVVGLLHLSLAAQPRWGARVRILWALAALSLVFSMTLAVLYAARPYFLPIPWLDIPWMRALHGSANVFGFALASVVGWRSADAGRSATPQPDPSH